VATSIACGTWDNAATGRHDHATGWLSRRARRLEAVTAIQRVRQKRVASLGEMHVRTALGIVGNRLHLASAGIARNGSAARGIAKVDCVACLSGKGQKQDNGKGDSGKAHSETP